MFYVALYNLCIYCLIEMRFKIRIYVYFRSDFDIRFLKISPIYPWYISIPYKFFLPIWPLWPQFRTLTPRQQIIHDLRLQLHNLIFIHVHNVKRPQAWAVMNWGGILCMSSQQSNPNYHGHYNKSTCGDYAVTEITHVPSAPCTPIR